ncbi:PAS domain S-box protein [Halomicrobium urmianum]|uniref:PAS domain S-box protein n=1 Tax=Halomicrobium urmianum TaxID=1586233 RepID=UPI001CD93493|nr:PAS domain S-box protein [Halomicrobium urmianum]
MTSSSLSDSLQETLALFDPLGAPQTTLEVAEKLDIGRRSTYERLERLVDHGELETKKAGTNGRVWWRPRPSPTEQTATAHDWPGLAEPLVNDVLNDAAVGVFVLNEDSEVAWINDTLERYFGFDREQVLGQDKRKLVRDQIAPLVDDRESFVETVLATYDNNTYAERFECRVTAGEGRDARWLEHRSKPIESGQYAGGRIELYYDITERKRSEDARHETEEQFQSLVDAVEEDAIFRLDAEGHVVSWNEGAKEIKGYDAEEILGEHVSMFYTEEDRAAGVPERNLERATEVGSIKDEGWRVRKDGTRFWAAVTITAVQDEDGTPRGYLKITRDMTDRHEREQELENELQRVFDRISDGFYAVDEEFRFTIVNERAEELLQRSEADLLGETVWDVFPDARDSQGFDEFSRALATGVSRTYEENFSGTWFEVTVYPSASGLSVYFQDVTERKERERELERYEQTIETVWDGVVTLDADDRFVMVNDAFCEMAGYDREELLGDPVTLVHDVAISERAEELNEDILAGEQEYATIEFDLETADGEIIPVEGRFGPYELEDGSIGRTGVVRDISERKERERELANYETIVETSPVGITIVDSDGEMQFANGRAEEIFGRSITQINNLSFEDPAWDEVAENGEPISRDELPFPRIMESEEPLFDQISGVLRPDGERVWISVNGAPVYDDRGEITSVVFAIEDITEQKERDQALRESEARYRSLTNDVLDTSDVGTFILNSDFEVVWINEAIEEFFGLDREATVGQNKRALIEAEIADIFEEPERFANRVTATYEDNTYTEEFESHVLGEGSLEERWVNHWSQPIESGLYAGGRIEHYTDITERKERERALEESERRYRTLVENFPNGAVGLFDDDLRYTVIGGELLDATGVSPEDRIGNSVYDIYPDDIVEEIEPYFEAALEGEANSFEVEFRDRDLFAYTLPIRNDDGGVFAGMLVIQDVTERREYQRKLEESNERLEQFAYAVSHDLQEPLRMVTSYIKLIESRYGDKLDEDGEEFLEFAVDGAERMREMIEGLLEYSRIETRGDPFEPVDLDDILDNVREDLQMRIDESNAEITTDDLPRVDGDESQLRQVFQNLLSNAIEYNEDEPPQIDVSATRDDQRWIISVQDNGIGIDPGEQDRIFEVFQRLHTNEEHSGTGIGLALSRRVVERHGGEIWVDSEPDEGSTFSFTLPAVDT